MITTKSLTMIAIYLAFIICNSLVSATPLLQGLSEETPQSRARLATLDRAQVEKCRWEVGPLSLPLNAPHDLVARALTHASLPHLRLFKAHARRAEITQLSPNDSGSSRVWRWGARLDLNNPRERLTRDQSLLEYVTALYAVCTWPDSLGASDSSPASTELTGHDTKDQQLTFWSSHPFQVWLNGHLMGHSDTERSLTERRSASRLLPFGWAFPLTSQSSWPSSVGRSDSNQEPRLSQLLLRFEAHRGEVTWTVRRSTDEPRSALQRQTQHQANTSQVRHRVHQTSGGSQGSGEAAAGSQNQVQAHKNRQRDIDHEHLQIAPLLKPLRPLVSPQELSQLIARAQWTQPRRVQLTAEIGIVKRSISSNDPAHRLHSPRRFTQQDQLYYIPRSWVNHKSLRSDDRSIGVSEPLGMEPLPKSRTTAWMLLERSQMKRGLDRIYFTIRHLETSSGHWVLISARCLWRRPIWSEEWADIPWTPLPSRVWVASALSNMDHWRTSGWVRSGEVLNRSGLMWINALSPDHHSTRSMITRDGPRGAWLRWSAFNHWREVTALYQRGVHLEMMASRQRSQPDPSTLSPKWLNAYRAPNRLIHEPLTVRWRFSDPKVESRPLNQATHRLKMSAWIDELKRLMMPQTSTPALPVGVVDDFAPGRFALTLAEREDAQLIVWSPPNSDPLFDQPRALDHWGVLLKRAGQDPRVTHLQALNGHPIPGGSPWVLIGSPRDHSALDPTSSMQNYSSVQPFTAQSSRDLLSAISRSNGAQTDRSLQDHNIHLMRVAPHTAHVMNVELRLNFLALSTESKQVRTVWQITPMISLDELWGDEVRSPSAIPDQLNALWRAPHRWNPRPRWWRGLPDRGTQRIIEDWGAWWRRRAEVRGIKRLRAHASNSDHRSGSRASSSGATSQFSGLRGWWTVRPDQIWVPQLQLNQLLKRMSRPAQPKSISLRRVIQIDQALVRRRCSVDLSQAHRIRHPLLSYHSAWEYKGHQGREGSHLNKAQHGQKNLTWTTTLRILGEITSVSDQRQRRDLTRVINQIERVESTHCLTATLTSSHRE